MCASSLAGMWTEVVAVPVLLVIAAVLPLVAHELGHLVTDVVLGGKPRRLGYLSFR